MILGMTVLTEQILLGHSSRIVPLTTDQYHDMIRNGIITEGSPIDSSLEHDRTTKLRIYAAAGIAQHVIIM